MNLIERNNILKEIKEYISDFVNKEKLDICFNHSGDLYIKNIEYQNKESIKKEVYNLIEKYLETKYNYRYKIKVHDLDEDDYIEKKVKESIEYYIVLEILHQLDKIELRIGLMKFLNILNKYIIILYDVDDFNLLSRINNKYIYITVYEFIEKISKDKNLNNKIIKYLIKDEMFFRDNIINFGWL